MGSRELHNLNDRIAALGISEDDEGISFAQTEDAQMTGALPQFWTITGRFLTDKPIKFEVMQQVLASVWRPAMGVRISQASSGIYLFNFCTKAVFVFMTGNKKTMMEPLPQGIESEEMQG
ncbi:unnamed protein product [Cuscuta campestris]|uniref:DUF4283 domain-containing protein n=1 Tax=Cuscuta campestris TaxID=132261 RepID=A0A484MB03_9ASTE|nr:unnamed protein product [Cuscuta campestris]